MDGFVVFGPLRGFEPIIVGNHEADGLDNKESREEVTLVVFDVAVPAAAVNKVVGNGAGGGGGRELHPFCVCVC